MIDFKTYDEQIEILEKRGLIITDKNAAKKILKIHNYYNLINAYKDVFIDKSTNPETFVKGVTFDELFSLHQFDKELRLLLSHYLILVERYVKSILAHEFSRKHPNHDLDYLDISNYNNQPSSAKQPVIIASEVIRKLNKALLSALAHNDPRICHYKNKYNRVPLWIFVNYLTFGTVSKTYKALQSTDQDAIAKSIGEISNQKIYANDIINALIILVQLRNKCAHDQTIFNFSSHPTIAKSNKFLQSYSVSQAHSLFAAISCFSLFVKAEHFTALVERIKTLIKDLFLNIHSIPTNTILIKMGIPQQFINKKD